MKILISSHSFCPSIGGLETVSEVLANEFVRQGHEVKLVTQTAAGVNTTFSFQVIRQPLPKHLFNLVHWCDLYWHSNLSLQSAWPLLFMRKSCVVTHHTWIPREGGLRNWKGRLKHFLLQYATCISISQAIADHISTSSVVIPNPYDDSVFYERPEIRRDKGLVFVGRLVSSKGMYLVLEALAKLKFRQHILQLTVVGEGPEETALRKQAKFLGVYDQVSFVGVKNGNELAKVLNAHQVMVVPSVWQEPFGVVAVEGIACGCVIVGSAGGGLKDAIGPCGVIFPNGDVSALTGVLADLFSNPEKMQEYRVGAKSHLSYHTKSVVSKAYLRVFETALRRM